MNSKNPGHEVRPNGHRHWPRHRPVFVMMAFLFALAYGAVMFTFQYKFRWTPLDRFYFPAYFRTAHLVHSRNPYLRPSHSLIALFIAYPHATRMALDSEVVPAVPPASVAHKTLAFALSNDAIQNSAQRLEWRSMRFDASGCTPGSTTGFITEGRFGSFSEASGM